MTGMAALMRADFSRAPVLGTARPDDFKEWHHFVMHQPGLRLLVNFSLTRERVLVPRLAVLVHGERWSGMVERFADTDAHISADLGTVAIGASRMTVAVDGYRVRLDLPERDISGDLHLVPTSRPFVVNNQPAGSGRLSWLFVPRLRADGWVRAGGTRHELRDAPAYHDHNWGRFRWGDDFGWEWSSVLPSEPDDPWSFVFTRVTDRSRLRTFYQALFAWHGDEPAAMFRDAALRVHESGRLARPPDCTLPPPMRLVLGGQACDVPERTDITASRGDDTLTLAFCPQAYARIALPSEVRPDRSVVLSEASGSATARGRIGGTDIDFAGSGVFEVLRG